ncbi:MAG: hypothetical protein ACYDD7_22205 [Acidimicrobiales bacterium]
MLVLGIGAYVWLAARILNAVRDLLEHGETLWEEALRTTPAGLVRPLDLGGISRRRRAAAAAALETSSPRSLMSYILFPRPVDFLSKALVIGPITALLGAAMGGFDKAPPLCHVAAVLAVWEYLIYQARYQVNDVIGAEEDSGTPDSTERWRLPLILDDADDPVQRHRNHTRKVISIASALLRVLLAVTWVLIYSPRREGLILAGITGITASAAILYELARRSLFQFALEAVNVGAGTVASVWQDDPRRRQVRGALACVYSLIGIGYGARALVALDLGTNWRLPMSTASLTFFFMVCVGCFGCLMVWTADCAKYIDPASTLPARKVLSTLALRPHIHLLGVHTDVIAEDANSVSALQRTGDDRALLHERLGGHPWRAPFLAAMIIAFFASASLSQWSGARVQHTRLTLGLPPVLCLAVAVMCSESVRSRMSKSPVSSNVTLAIGVAGPIALGLALTATLGFSSFAAVLPFLVASGSYRWLQDITPKAMRPSTLSRAIQTRREHFGQLLSRVRQELG